MRHAPKARSAFTFIELTIVIFILAILSVALAISYQRIQAEIQFDAHVTRLTGLFQKARGLSLSTLMVNDSEPTEYYLLELIDGAVVLSAVGATSEQIIEQYDFDEGLTFMGSLNLYYIPPYGELCIGGLDPCDTGAVAQVLFSDDSGNAASFTVEAAGAYVEVESF